MTTPTKKDEIKIDQDENGYIVQQARRDAKGERSIETFDFSKDSTYLNLIYGAFHSTISIHIDNTGSEKSLVSVYDHVGDQPAHNYHAKLDEKTQADVFHAMEVLAKSGTTDNAEMDRVYHLQDVIHDALASKGATYTVGAKAVDQKDLDAIDQAALQVLNGAKKTKSGPAK